MKIKVLDSAVEDLYDARRFYERQGEGLGVYFFPFFRSGDRLSPACGAWRVRHAIKETAAETVVAEDSRGNEVVARDGGRAAQ